MARQGAQVLLAALTALAAIAAPTTATAQATGSRLAPSQGDGPVEGIPGALPAGPGETTGGVAGELGVGQIDEDLFLTIELKFGMELPVPMLFCPHEELTKCFTRLRFGVLGPLRLRVLDEAPEQDGVIRREDWDEFSDYLRIIRYVEYGYPHEPLHARIGELGPVHLGHGTIVNGYYNVITPDLYQLGIWGHVNTPFGGGGLLLDNVAAPSIFGTRLYARPVAFFDRQSWWTRLAVGTSLVVDADAPYRLALDGAGEVVVDPTRQPVVEEDRAATWLGFDVELNLIQHDWFQLTPYSDLNLHINTGGVGWHDGVLVGMAPLDALRLQARLEYRLVGEGYLPDYIGPLYEVERYQFAGWHQGLPAPKLRVAASRTGGAVHGVYGQLGGDILGIVALSGSLAEYQGPDNGSLWLRAAITPTDSFQLAAFYIKQNFNSFSEAFDLDGALLVGDLRASIAGPLYLHAQYNRLYRLRDDGEYESVDTWNVGLGAGFTF